MKNVILVLTLLISPAVFAAGIHSFSNQEALKKTLDTPDLNKQLRQLMQDAGLRDLQLVSADIDREKDDTFSIALGYEGRKVIQTSTSKGKPSHSKEIALKYGVVATLKQSIRKISNGGLSLEESYLTEPQLDLIAADGEE